MDKKAQLIEHLEGLPTLDLPHREAAKKALEELAFPSVKSEAWKYTRVAKITNQEYQVASDSDAAAKLVDEHRLPFEQAHTLVFVNGFLAEELSSFEASDCTIAPLDKASGHEAFQKHYGSFADHQTQIFTAFNTAFVTGGCFIHIPAKVQVDRPIHIIDVVTSDRCLVQPRHLIVAETGSEAHIVQSFGGTATDAFRNAVTEVKVGANTNLVLDKVQWDGDTRSIITEQVHQEKDSNFRINTATLQGKFTRNNLNIEVDGQNCNTYLHGLYLPDGKEHIDNHTMVDHKVPHCESNEVYKGILCGESTGVFNGKVFVRPDAQKTNAYQSNANILMTDTATMNAKPELEIYADDVQCSHGSTTGQFDEEAVFYLRSRGIGEESARQLLVAAFAADVLDGIQSEVVREHVDKLLEVRLAHLFS